MADILILGGSGFVSSSIAKHLIRRGYSIDILTRGLKPINYSGFENHLICDRTNEDTMKSILQYKNYSYIFDISGYTKNDVSILFKSISNINNLKRYIFCSTAAVYAPTENIVFESSPICMDLPEDSYASNKIAAENYIFDLIESKKLRATIFRPTYIYGEGNDLLRESHFLNRIKDNKIIPIPDDNVKVQFIHIEDLVKNFECAMFNDNDCRAYNLTSPYRYTWEEIIDICSKVVGAPAKTKKIALNSFDVKSYFPFQSININLDITQLRENGFHSPMVYLDEGLASSYKWLQWQNPTFKPSKMTMVDNI